MSVSIRDEGDSAAAGRNHNYSVPEEPSSTLYHNGPYTPSVVRVLAWKNVFCEANEETLEDVYTRIFPMRFLSLVS